MMRPPSILKKGLLDREYEKINKVDIPEDENSEKVSPKESYRNDDGSTLRRMQEMLATDLGIKQ
jgi:hypothetical protein